MTRLAGLLLVALAVQISLGLRESAVKSNSIPETT